MGILNSRRKLHAVDGLKLSNLYSPLPRFSSLSALLHLNLIFRLHLEFGALIGRDQVSNAGLAQSCETARGVKHLDRSKGIVLSRALAHLDRFLGSEISAVHGAIDSISGRLDNTGPGCFICGAQIDLENELDQDQDYATYEKRYTERMNKARDQAAGLITSPGERALFQQDLDLNIQRGLGNVMQKAKNKEKDVGRGALLDTIATNRETALRSTDEATRASVIQSTTDAINGAMDRGYLTAQEAVKMRQGATEDYALASVQMLDPSGRLAALSKSGIADLIPTDKRAELKMQAENQIEMEQRRQAAEARQRAVEVRQLQAINRMELSSRVQDAQSAYSQGYEYENPPSKADFYA
ncbi:hypothetical protein HUT00_28645, partial [Pseudomonas chlororaphis]|nr:hypothetical protein [Pseudomonas chlororaphis]